MSRFERPCPRCGHHSEGTPRTVLSGGALKLVYRCGRCMTLWIYAGATGDKKIVIERPVNVPLHSTETSQ